MKLTKRMLRSMRRHIQSQTLTKQQRDDRGKFVKRSV